MGEAGGKEKGGGVAHDPSDGQDTAGDDAVNGAGQHDGTDHMPLSAPQAQRPLPIGGGHGFQGFLGGTHDGGQGHDDQRERARQQAFAQQGGEDEHAHQSVDDGGDAGEGLGGEFNDGHQLSVPGVLGEVNGGAHAQRQHDHQCGDDNIERVEDIGQNADVVRQVAGLGRDEVPRHMGKAPVEDIADHEHQQGTGEKGAEIEQAAQGLVIELSCAGELFHIHVLTSPCSASGAR